MRLEKKVPGENGVVCVFATTSGDHFSVDEQGVEGSADRRVARDFEGVRVVRVNSTSAPYHKFLG